MTPYDFHELESLEGLFPGLYELQVTAPGYSPAYETISLRDGPNVKEVTLEQAVDAVIHVTAGESDSPLAWAEVFALPKENDLFRETSKLRQCRTGA